MIPVPLKPLLIAIGLSVVNADAWALLNTDKTVINSNTGVATISVSFPKPISGDLYLATEFNGQLYFFAENGTKFTTDIIPFVKNGSFTVDLEVLKLSSEGVPPASYTLYQVVTVAGKSLMDISNWVGGLSGLSSLQLSINLPLPTAVPVTPTPIVTATPTLTPTSIPEPTASPTPTPIVSPTPSNNCTANQTSNLLKALNTFKEKEADTCNPSPTPSPTPTVTPGVDGKSTYIQYCSSCHGTNPSANVNDVMNGKEPTVITNAINQNAGGVMAVLRGRLSSEQINAISNYLRTFQPKSAIND